MQLTSTGMLKQNSIMWFEFYMQMAIKVMVFWNLLDPSSP